MSFDFRYSDLNKEKFIFGNSNLLNKPEILYLDYVFEELSDKIRNFVKKSKLNISVMFLPGKKLRNVFCSSHPYDHRKSLNTNCDTCPRITTEGKNRFVNNIVFKKSSEIQKAI